MTTIILTSQSSIKIDAVKAYFEKQSRTIKLELYDCKDADLPEQPVDCGKYCAFRRIMHVLKLNGIKKISNDAYVISIESDIQERKSQSRVDYVVDYVDVANVMIYHRGLFFSGQSLGITCPKTKMITDQWAQMRYSEHINGYRETVGEQLHKEQQCNPKNWMLDLLGQDRKLQIVDGLTNAWEKMNNTLDNMQKISKTLMVYSDFPKTGIDFKYFYSLFTDPKTMRYFGNILEDNYMWHEFDAVIPLESRGLVLGSVLADRLKTRLIPAQKPGKIPGEVFTIQYGKEYGTDEFQMSVDLIKSMLRQNKEHYHFLIVDDLIATGGTICAVLSLLDSFFEIHKFTYSCEIFAVTDIPSLREIAKEKIGQPYTVLFE